MRIDALSESLARQLRQAPSINQRAAAFAACEFAIKRTQCQIPAVLSLLEKLRFGQAAIEDSHVLAEIVEKLDDEYFNAQESDDSSDADGVAALATFSLARAVASLAFAFRSDAFESAAEAIYEASVSTDDPDDLLEIVRATLETERQK